MDIGWEGRAKGTEGGGGRWEWDIVRFQEPCKLWDTCYKTMFWDQSLSDAGGWGGGQGFLWRSDGFHRGMISCCQQSLAGEL